MKSGMPTGRGYRAPRCEGCGLLPESCICAELPATPSTVSTAFIVHFREWRKPTNTAKLAALLLGANSRVLLRGGPSPALGQRAEEQLADLDRELGLVLYPSDDAVPLSELVARDGRERWAHATLIVPDGTWSQSRRVVRRTPSLLGHLHVKLDAQVSRYRLRRGTEVGLLCTLEAVGYALAVLDPAFNLTSYLRSFEEWQNRALLRRWGKIPDWTELGMAASSDSED